MAAGMVASGSPGPVGVVAGTTRTGVGVVVGPPALGAVPVAAGGWRLPAPGLPVPTTPCEQLNDAEIRTMLAAHTPRRDAIPETASRLELMSSPESAPRSEARLRKPRKNHNERPGACTRSKFVMCAVAHDDATPRTGQLSDPAQLPTYRRARLLPKDMREPRASGSDARPAA